MTVRNFFANSRNAAASSGATRTRMSQISFSSGPGDERRAASTISSSTFFTMSSLRLSRIRHTVRTRGRSTSPVSNAALSSGSRVCKATPTETHGSATVAEHPNATAISVRPYRL